MNMICSHSQVKAMLHEAFFLQLATQLATQFCQNRPIRAHLSQDVGHLARPPSCLLLYALQVAKKIALVWHPLCNLKGFLFVIVALQIARKIASCNLAFKRVSFCLCSRKVMKENCLLWYRVNLRVSQTMLNHTEPKPIFDSLLLLRLFALASLQKFLSSSFAYSAEPALSVFSIINKFSQRFLSLSSLRRYFNNFL